MGLHSTQKQSENFTLVPNLYILFQNNNQFSNNIYAMEAAYYSIYYKSCLFS